MRLHWITYSLIAYFFFFLQPVNAVKIKNDEAKKISLSEPSNIVRPTFSVQKSVPVKSPQNKLSSGRHLLLLQNILEADNFVNCTNSNVPVSFLHATLTDTRSREIAKAPALPLHKSFSFVLLSTVLLFPNHFFW